MQTHIKPTHGTLEWLQLRHKDAEGRVRFGASEAPILAGVSHYRNLVDLAIAKWDEPEVNEMNEAMKRGHVLEPALITEASAILGCEVITPNFMYEHERFIATLDGVTFDEHGDIDTIIEAKTTTQHSNDDPLPVEFYWQVLAQMFCTGARHALVIMLDKRMRIGTYRLERTDDVEADIEWLAATAETVGAMLDAKQLPDIPMTESQVKSLYPNPAGSIEVGSSGLALLREWQAAAEARKSVESHEQLLRDKVAQLLGVFDTGTVDGQPVVSFKARKGSSRLDLKRLEAEHPGLVAGYRVQGAPFRVLRMLGGA